MFFCIKTVLSAQNRPADDLVTKHRAYLTRNAHRFIALGPTFNENDSAAEGSLYLLEADDWDDARSFVKNDPLTKAGARADIEIWEWVLKGFNRSYPVDGSAI